MLGSGDDLKSGMSAVTAGGGQEEREQHEQPATHRIPLPLVSAGYAASPDPSSIGVRTSGASAGRGPQATETTERDTRALSSWAEMGLEVLSPAPAIRRA
jgi:hypothetical protein